MKYEYNYAMISKNSFAHIHPITTYQNGGTYVLQIILNQPISLSFGRFQKAKQYSLEPAQYLYIGSALTQANRPALLQRTARHASRTNPHQPHSAQEHLLAYAQTLAIPPQKILLKQNKKLHWHIDHFLECPQADLTDIFLIPHTITYESILATQLAAHPHILTPIPVLGLQTPLMKLTFSNSLPNFPPLNLTSSSKTSSLNHKKAQFLVLFKNLLYSLTPFKSNRSKNAKIVSTESISQFIFPSSFIAFNHSCPPPITL